MRKAEVRVQSLGVHHRRKLLTTTKQLIYTRENHITVVVGCRKGQHHQSIQQHE